MLDDITEYLDQAIPKERSQIYLDALKVVLSYNAPSPIETVHEIISVADSYPKEDVLLLIDSAISNSLQDILVQHYITTRGNVLEQLVLLKGLNLLENYLDSEVILSLFDESLSSDEMLFTYLTHVTNKPVEYFDSFVIDVRPILLTRLIEKHSNDQDALVENYEDYVDQDKLIKVKALAKTNPEALGVQCVSTGLIKVGTDLSLLLNLTRAQIYELSSLNQMALAIYSLVLVSNTPLIEIPKMSTHVVNDLFDEFEVVSELTHLVTSFK